MIAVYCNMNVSRLLFVDIYFACIVFTRFSFFFLRSFVSLAFICSCCVQCAVTTSESFWLVDSFSVEDNNSNNNNTYQMPTMLARHIPCLSVYMYGGMIECVFVTLVIQFSFGNSPWSMMFGSWMFRMSFNSPVLYWPK